MSDAFFHGVRVLEVDADAGLLATANGGGLGAPYFRLSVIEIPAGVAAGTELATFSTSLADAVLSLVEDSDGQFAIGSDDRLLAGEVPTLPDVTYAIRASAAGPSRTIQADFTLIAVERPGQADFGQDGNPLITII